MCGIAGLLNYKSQDAVLSLNKMLDLIQHRGPNDRGTWVKENCALGHVRLSIIDLTAAGHQPMECTETGNILVFNGEIYNYLELREDLRSRGYQFKSKTDTEVILAAYWQWGRKCLERFVGMFAFALYDLSQNYVWLVRDRFGIKPLYYTKVREGFAFASEIKALLFGLDVKRKANLRAVKDFVVNRKIDANHETFFEEIYQIKAGHEAWISVDNPRVNQECYYSPEFSQGNDLSKDEITTKIKDMLTDSVRLRLRSDVPVGTMLSGGLDSSTITCLANEVSENEQFHSFSSVTRPQTPESSLIETIEKCCQTVPHHNSPHAADFFENLLSLIWHQDEPFADGSMYAHFNLMALARKENVPVILTGQGGDEIFCGYLFYLYSWLGDYLKRARFIKWWKNLRHVSTSCEKGLVFLVFSSFRHILPLKFKNFLSRFRCNERTAILSQDAKSQAIDHTTAYKGCKGFKLFYLNQLRHWTLPGFLHYEDRNSMAFGVEARVPFLDHRLVEFVMSIDWEMFLSEGVTKHLLRSSMQNSVPDAVLIQKGKFAFPAPLERWLFEGKGKVQKWLELSSEVPFLNHKMVRRSFEKFNSTKSKRMLTAVWRALVLTLWYHIFISGKLKPNCIPSSYR